MFSVLQTLRSVVQKGRSKQNLDLQIVMGTEPTLKEKRQEAMRYRGDPQLDSALPSLRPLLHGGGQRARIDRVGATVR